MRESELSESNGLIKVLLYASDVNLSVASMNAIRSNAELLQVCKGMCLEVNTDRIQYMNMT
jgi:hypothetical protein